MEDGTLKSAQVAVARRGKLAGLRTFGTVQHDGIEQEVAATDRTLYTIFSCTKAIVGSATWTVCEDGLLAIDEKVSDIIPEFGTNGKENITVEQVMLHIGGVPPAPVAGAGGGKREQQHSRVAQRVMLHIGGFPLAPMAATEWDNRERRLSRFAQWRLNWEPGTKFEYHATSAHWVLAEIIERKTGKDFRAYVRERILDPMGLDDFYIGLPASENGRVADVRHLVPPTPPPGGWGEVTPDAIKTFNRPEVRAVGVPGGGGVGGAAQLAMFYQPLVNGGTTADGTRIMKAETIEWATTVRTKDFHRDMIFNNPVNRALTVVVAGGDGNAHIRGFGKATSARAFGHGGAGGQIGWGDPETGISVGYTTDGFLDDVQQARRGVAISSLAAQVLA